MPLPPPAPPPPPPPPVANSAPVPKTKDRAALLNDIQKGRTLKKAVTNDRSAPIIDGKATGSSSANANPRPSLGGGSSKFPAPAVPTGPISFADELNRRLGGSGTVRNVAKNSSDGNCGSTNGGPSSTPTSGANTPVANGVSRPLPPPPPPTAPSFSSKPVQPQVPKPPAASTKPMAPQPNRSAPGTSNGVGRNGAKPLDAAPSDEDDGRFRGPSVKQQMKAFGSSNQFNPSAGPPQAQKHRLSTENSWNGDYSNDDGVYAMKAPPPPPPSKPPSKPPQKDSRFHTLNPSRMKQQVNTANIPRSGSHENLPASDGLHPPVPPPKMSTARSPGSVARPAPPPPGRPPERPHVAPPPPPPPTSACPPPPVQKTPLQAVNGRHNTYGSRNNEPNLRNAYVDNSPAPPPRRESLMPDFERRFTFLALNELPPPEEFRNIPKIYGRPAQQRRNAPEPPTHR